MKIMKNGELRDATPEEQADIIAAQGSVTSAAAIERQPGIIAQVRLRIEADVVESASTDGGLSSSSVFAPGLLWCEFPVPIDGEYLVWPSNGATHRCYSLPDEQFPEGFAVRSQSYDGEDTFPTALQILVTKS